MCNQQRIDFLDFARGCAILFMILQHSMFMYGEHAGEESIIGILVLLSGTAPAAPVFMLIMGVFLMRSKTHGIRYGIVRGLKLITLGYALNLFRFFIPVRISEFYGMALQENGFSRSLFFVDILQMAGLSLILMALLKRFLPYRKAWALLAAAIALVSPLLWGAFDQIPGTSLLWGTGEHVFFPVFPWIIYPLVGMYISDYLLDSNKMDSLMKQWSFLGFSMIVVGGVLWRTVSNSVFIEGDYYRSGPAVHLVILGFVLMWLPICRYIVIQVQENAAFRLLYHWSRNVTVVYFIQWVLIGWGLLVFGFREKPAPIALIIGIGTMVLTDILTRAYLRFQRMIKA